MYVAYSLVTFCVAISISLAFGDLQANQFFRGLSHFCVPSIYSPCGTNAEESGFDEPFYQLLELELEGLQMSLTSNAAIYLDYC